MRRVWVGSIAVIWLFSLSFLPTLAQDAAVKPFTLPIAAPAGPSTWLFGQPYGNTVGAYNYGTAWYSAGQGLHFGIDLSMPCGTPVVAVADGDVIYADNLAFGAGPHNLIVRHSAANLTVLYGHLLDKPIVQQYQPVTRGQVLGYSGDPDLTCDSRPHLHFEVRSLDYSVAYNPINYIEANWDVLAGIGSFNNTLFQQDLTNPRQWMTLEDQPAVAFGGARVNAYAQSWPPAQEDRAPGSALPVRTFGPLAAEATFGLRAVGSDGCCAVFGWLPDNANRFWAVDGSPGQQAALLQWDLSAGDSFTVGNPAPPPSLSPDGTIQIIQANGQVTLRRLADGTEWTVQTNGFTPTVSPDSTRLLWQVQYETAVPGATPPPIEFWISNLDGSGAQMILSGTRISASWLDGTRLLLSHSAHTLNTLSVYNVADGSRYDLGTWDRIRAVSASPGGSWLLFYQTFQSDPAVNAVYALQTQPGAQPQKLPWFGGWRWRDSESVYYLPFDPSISVQTLAYYHIPTGENRFLTDPQTTPFTIVNGAWSVSADGQRILFQNAADKRLWLLETQNPTLAG